MIVPRLFENTVSAVKEDALREKKHPGGSLYDLPTHNQNGQLRFNYNVLTHDAWGKWCWRRELVSLYKHQPVT